MNGLKPTPEQALDYLHAKYPDMTFKHEGFCIWHLLCPSNEWTIYCHVVELHWDKNGSVGARGFPL